MSRPDTFKLRVNATERELLRLVAQRLDRTDSDAVRLLVKERARELGIAPTNEQRQPDSVSVRV